MTEPSPGENSSGRLLTGSVRTTVLWLAFPVLLEQLLSFFVGFYDTWLSGRISAEATTAIGLAAYVGWLASMLFSLVGTGTTALVARSWGAGEYVTANRVTNRSMAMAGVMGVLVYGVIYSTAPLFTRFLNMSPETARITIRYVRIDGFGHLFTGLSLAGAAALRGVGDMRSPMLILGLVNVLNVIVSTALVFGIGPVPALGIDQPLLAPWGIDGIVGGTVTARLIGGVVMLVALSRGLSGLRLLRRELRLRGETVRRILRVGGPAALDGLIMWAGQFLYLMIIARLGVGEGGLDKAIFAAHIIGVRVEAITYLPAVAWGAATATLVGQTLGAGDRKRAVRIGHEAVLQCTLLGLVITAVFYFGAGIIYRLMHTDPAVQQIGTEAFRMLAFFQVPLVVSIVYISALRGAGDTRTPLLFTIFGLALIRLPLGYLFGIVLHGGLYGAWIGMCGDMLIRAIFAAWRFHGGRWLDSKI